MPAIAARPNTTTVAPPSPMRIDALRWVTTGAAGMAGRAARRAFSAPDRVLARRYMGFPSLAVSVRHSVLQRIPPRRHPFRVSRVASEPDSRRMLNLAICTAAATVRSANSQPPVTGGSFPAHPDP
ncbi:MAG: hypothetical protein JWP54_1814 [Cryobacterium sp.]|nr:hypothetical protein [Cryobacterium sp.]